METGTFISRDPLGHVDGPNVYCYVRQNPWTAWDPEGLATVSVGGMGMLTDRRDFRPAAGLEEFGQGSGGRIAISNPKAYESVPEASGEATVESEEAMLSRAANGIAREAIDDFHRGIMNPRADIAVEHRKLLFVGSALGKHAPEELNQLLNDLGHGAYMGEVIDLGAVVVGIVASEGVGAMLSAGKAVPLVGSRIAAKTTAGTGAESANAGSALRSKLSALEDAQSGAASTRTLPDGRVRYYGPETPARTAGPTRGASYVTEHNPATGGVRSWMESYNQAGNVNRVHPKMINGQQVHSQHYPPTAKELGR
jgi:hypothetical protein